MACRAKAGFTGVLPAAHNKWANTLSQRVTPSGTSLLSATTASVPRFGGTKNSTNNNDSNSLVDVFAPTNAMRVGDMGGGRGVRYPTQFNEDLLVELDAVYEGSGVVLSHHTAEPAFGQGYVRPRNDVLQSDEVTRGISARLEIDEDGLLKPEAVVSDRVEEISGTSVHKDAISRTSPRIGIDAQSLESLKGEIRSFNGLRGYAKAKLSKNSDLEIIIKPYKNHSINMVISGNNAGELLRRGQYYKNGYGGLFKASVFYKNRTKVSGSLEIEELRIKNAPVLAQIISSASIVGLLDNLNGNGLLFTRIEGSFDYNDGELALKDGVAVGPSLGLTMAGYERYGKKQNTVNVNGLVSPVYIINGVVKAIPLIGELLGGEKGEGVFGVSYKVQGNSSNPRVLVNPLSILTPGIFRKIFNIQENVNR